MKASEKYGRLTYLGKRERGVPTPKGLFLCDCGTEKWIALGSVKRGRSKSCGCLRMPPIKLGKRFGRLIFLGKLEHGGINRKGLFLCECGTEKWCRLSGVKSGNTKSCGCLSKELASARNQKLVDGVHSEKHPIYKVWAGIKQRCNSPSCNGYLNYGGRGISICPEWQGPEGFANFVKDMGPRPKGTSIDRIDNDGDYTPDNCRWATLREQNNNKRNNRRLTIDGESLTVAQWSRRSGIKVGTIYDRASKGWSAKDAVFAPVISPGRRPASSQRG